MDTKIYRFVEHNDNEGETFNTLVKLTVEEAQVIKGVLKEFELDEDGEGIYTLVPEEKILTIEKFEETDDYDHNDYSALFICATINGLDSLGADSDEVFGFFYKRSCFEEVEPEEFFK